MNDFYDRDDALTVEGKRRSSELYAHDPEAALSGQGCVSAETEPALSRSQAMTEFILSSPSRFLKLSAELPPLVQDMLYQYHLLGRTQKQIAGSLGTSQWNISRTISLAACFLATSATRQGRRRKEALKELSSIARNHTPKPPLKISEPKVLGRFEIDLSGDFEACFSPETINGSIAKALP